MFFLWMIFFFLIYHWVTLKRQRTNRKHTVELLVYESWTSQSTQKTDCVMNKCMLPEKWNKTTWIIIFFFWECLSDRPCKECLTLKGFFRSTRIFIYGYKITFFIYIHMQFLFPRSFSNLNIEFCECGWKFMANVKKISMWRMIDHYKNT